MSTKEVASYVSSLLLIGGFVVFVALLASAVFGGFSE